MISIVRGEQYVFEFVNPQYQQLRPHTQMLGRSVAEVFPEALEQGFIALLDNVYRTGEPFIGRELALQYDRTGTGAPVETYFDFVYQPVYTGSQVSGITCFAIDVTERVRMRQQLDDSLSGNTPAHA